MRHLRVWISMKDRERSKRPKTYLYSSFCAHPESRLFISFSADKNGGGSKINNPFGARTRFDWPRSLKRECLLGWSFCKVGWNSSRVCIEMSKQRPSRPSSPPQSNFRSEGGSEGGEECGFKEGSVWNSSIYTRDSQEIGMHASSKRTEAARKAKFRWISLPYTAHTVRNKICVWLSEKAHAFCKYLTHE